jgi:hypothetical protein
MFVICGVDNVSAITNWHDVTITTSKETRIMSGFMHSKKLKTNKRIIAIFY